jgi:hypothetical protein
MVTVQVLGHGSFAIRPEKINELLTWLKNNSVSVESAPVKSKNDNDILLNG